MDVDFELYSCMSRLFFLLGASLSTLPTSLLVYLSRSELPSLLPRNKYPGHARLTHVVSTLAAALSRWNPLTDLMLSTTRLSTYSSPPFREITSWEGERKYATAQSRVSFTPSSCLIRMSVVTSLSHVELRETP